jgi:hypothetical protein
VGLSMLATVVVDAEKLQQMAARLQQIVGLLRHLEDHAREQKDVAIP